MILFKRYSGMLCGLVCPKYAQNMPKDLRHNFYAHLKCLILIEKLERETRLELATPTLARSCRIKPRALILKDFMRFATHFKLDDLGQSNQIVTFKYAQGLKGTQL